jgi:hypothetical protein
MLRSKDIKAIIGFLMIAYRQCKQDDTNTQTASHIGRDNNGNIFEISSDGDDAIKRRARQCLNKIDSYPTDTLAATFRTLVIQTRSQQLDPRAASETFTWIAEPILEDGMPVLRYHEKADTKKFDKGELDTIIEKINKWFDAMDADAGNVSCGECGTVLYNESSSLAPSDRKPCPKCGSTKRAFSVQASSGIIFSSSVAAQPDVITYPQSLLKTARDLINLKQYNPAILMAHQACEIASESTIARVLAGAKHRPTKDAERSLAGGYHFANDQTRKLYTSLTGDDIQEQPFWPQFKEFVALRNEIVHTHKTASRSDAEAALDVATCMVNHFQ